MVVVGLFGVPLGIAEVEEHRVAGPNPRIDRRKLVGSQLLGTLAAHVERHAAADEALDLVLVDAAAIGEEVPRSVHVRPGMRDHVQVRCGDLRPGHTV
ncbi:unannotated protein [freshwater metagenome]|uniref:Unannotated protein n=1 Tax=freshwater metagenome TaxID=449393 RepID=A0A6J7EHH0_9ZZZZ